MMSEKKQYHFIVYALIDPRTDEVHYIGRTTRLKKRYNEHLNGKDPFYPQKNAWVNELIASGHLPIMKSLEHIYATIAQANQRENEWMDHYTKQGAQLFQTSHIDVTLPRHDIGLALGALHVDIRESQAYNHLSRLNVEWKVDEKKIESKDPFFLHYWLRRYIKAVQDLLKEIGD
jgi:predicted GIY-YIG superfamily endonuclease